MVLIKTKNEARLFADALRDKMSTGKKIYQETNDYKRFRFFPFNRPIVQSHVKSLAESIALKNDMDRYPVHVTQDMEIIDGQHRMKACEMLGIGVKYVVIKDFQKSDIGRLNKNQLKWSRKNWLHWYAESGNAHYQKLQTFMTDEKMRLTDTLVMLYGKNRKEALKSMQEGGFKWPEDSHSFHAHYDDVKRVLVELARVSPVQPKWLRGATFIQGVSRFIKRQDVDTSQFIEKALLNSAWLKKCTKWEDLEPILLNIWNYKVKSENRLKPVNESEQPDNPLDLFIQ